MRREGRMGEGVLSKSYVGMKTLSLTTESRHGKA